MPLKREEILQQYDRYIEQVRVEAKDLYWLYNFFFVINSALLGSALAGKLSPQYLGIAQIFGAVMSLYWLVIINKQRLWRNTWVSRIQELERQLKYPPAMQLWPTKKPSQNYLRDYLFGKRGLWRLLFFLPAGFLFIWIGLFIFSSFTG